MVAYQMTLALISPALFVFSLFLLVSCVCTTNEGVNNASALACVNDDALTVKHLRYVERVHFRDRHGGRQLPVTWSSTDRHAARENDPFRPRGF